MNFEVYNSSSVEDEVVTKKPHVQEEEYEILSLDEGECLVVRKTSKSSLAQDIFAVYISYSVHHQQQSSYTFSNNHHQAKMQGCSMAQLKQGNTNYSLGIVAFKRGKGLGCLIGG